MLTLIGKRLLSALFILLVVSFVTYLLLEWVPEDAATGLVGDFASEEQLQTVRQEMGLDQPIFLRFTDFVRGAILEGDLGDSLINGRPVSALIGERLPYTMLLTVVAMTIAVLVGTGVALLAATRPGSYVDLAVMTISTLGLSLPTFWVALLLMIVFALRLGWLPVAGAGTPAHLILPAITLALPLTAVVARIMRSSLLDVKTQDHVRTADAKGLKKTKVWRNHIMRNGMIPVLTLLGLQAGHLLGGAFVIETIFGWPGLGRLTVQAILDADIPVVLGAVILIAALYQLINLGVDITQSLLDPRVGQSAI